MLAISFRLWPVKVAICAATPGETRHRRPTQIVKRVPKTPAISAAFPQGVGKPPEVHEVLFSVVRMVIASLGVAPRAAFNGAATATITFWLVLVW